MPSRVVLLTGAAGGLGSVMAAALLADGHAVAAVDRSPEALARLAASLGRERLLPIEADLSQPAACAQAVAAAVAHFGRLEGVVNNAGIGMSAIRPDAETNHPGIAEMDAETWDRFFAVNVRAPLLVTQAALPHLRTAGWGRIVNNTTSYRTMLRVLPYGATKSALESMSGYGRSSSKAPASASMFWCRAARRIRRSSTTPRAGRATRCSGPRSWVRRSPG